MWSMGCYVSFHEDRAINSLANKYVITIPSLLGDGPPAIIVTCQPVCSMTDSPIVASVRGSLSIPLDTVTAVSWFSFSRYGSKNDSQLGLKVFFCLGIVWSRALQLAGLSIFFAAHLHFLRFIFEFLFYKVDHKCEPLLWGFLCWVLQLPLIFVYCPFLVNVCFPLCLVHQGLISLPILEHLLSCLHLEDTSIQSCVGWQNTRIIVKPFSYVLCEFMSVF